MKILISSNSPHTKTGYGTQSMNMGKMFQALGHRVDFFAWYGVQGGMLDAGNSTIFPRLSHPFGADAQTIVSMVKPDVLITLQDVWVLPNEFGLQVSVPWVAYTPIDCDPLPPPIKDVLKNCPYPLAFTHFGQRVMCEGGLEYAEQIPHAIDTAAFTPGSKAAARERLALPADNFIVAMVAANSSYPSRKSYPEALQAFKEFLQYVPTAVLYLHTELDPQGEGISLTDLCRLIDLPAGSVKTVNQADYKLGMRDDIVIDVYRAADVLLAPSKGEGFGLPIVEAQACGCPVITTNFSSMPEILVNGIAIEYLQKDYVPTGSWQVTVAPYEIVRALRHIYNRTESERMDGAAEGVRQMKARYSLTAVAPLWQRYLENIVEAK